MRLLTVLLLVGCGGTQARVAGRRAVRQAEWAPSTPRAPRYEIGSETWTPAGAEAVVVASVSALTSPPLVADEPLHRLAGQLLGMLGERAETPPGAVVEFATRWNGLVEPQPALFVAEAPDPAALAELVQDAMRGSVTRQPYNRVAVAVAEVPGGYRALALLSMRYCEIEPLPVSHAAGRPVALRGRILAPFRSARVVVTDSDSRTRQLPGRGEQTGFDVELAASPRPGRMQVEVLGDSERGVTVLANFPIWIGREPPAVLSYDASPGAGMTADEVAEELLRLANEARRVRGLGTLERLGVLDRVARAHSEDMHAHGFVGHTSKRTGSTTDRLARAGFQSPVVLENIGRGYSAREIHERLMLSPGHRQNLLQREVTHAGIGVVVEPEGGEQAFLATQVFARVTRALDPRTAAPELLRLINERRGRLGAPATEADDGLSSMARRAVTRFFEERRNQREVVDELNESLEPFGLAYRRVAVLFAATSSLEETAAMEPLMEPGVRVVGVGIAEGDHPEIGHRAIVTIVVLAWPR